MIRTDCATHRRYGQGPGASAVAGLRSGARLQRRSGGILARVCATLMNATRWPGALVDCTGCASNACLGRGSKPVGGRPRPPAVRPHRHHDLARQVRPLLRSRAHPSAQPPVAPPCGARQAHSSSRAVLSHRHALFACAV